MQFWFHGVLLIQCLCLRSSWLSLASLPSLSLSLSLLLSLSLSYFPLFQHKVSSQIEQMQADISQDVHPSEPLCLYLRHASTHSSTDCEGTAFPSVWWAIGLACECRHVILALLGTSRCLHLSSSLVSSLGAHMHNGQRYVHTASFNQSFSMRCLSYCHMNVNTNKVCLGF